MNPAYIVGHIAVKDPECWARYRAQVPDTLAPWGGELVFRGHKAMAFAGNLPYDDIVVIRFPDRDAVQNWFGSPAYQALIPLREQAAETILLCYDA